MFDQAPLVVSRFTRGMGTTLLWCLVAAAFAVTAPVLASTPSDPPVRIRASWGPAGLGANAVAAGPQGAAYISGFWNPLYTKVRPSSRAFQRRFGGGIEDAFVSALNSTDRPRHFTSLGGSSSDYARTVSVDSRGSVYTAGLTKSQDFPLASPLQLRRGRYSPSRSFGFVSKLDPKLSRLVYSTYFVDASSAAPDRKGNAYIAGLTLPDRFPHARTLHIEKKGKPPVCGERSEDFAVKLSPLGKISWVVYVTGTCSDEPAVKADGRGAAYILMPPYLVKIDPSGKRLVYARLIRDLPTGFSSAADLTWLAVDPKGNAYVTSWTDAPSEPASRHAFQRTFGGGRDAFVLKLKPNGGLAYLTFLGGSGWDWGLAVEADSGGNAYVAGQTNSPDFPARRSVQPFSSHQCLGHFAGSGDLCYNAFVAKLNASGTKLDYSTFLGKFPIDPVGEYHDNLAWGVAAQPHGRATTIGSFGVVSLGS